MYNITGYWAGSHVRGSTESITRLQKNTVHSFQRPDADYTELDETATTLGGHAGSVAFGKISGERTRFNSFVGYKTPGFDVNDLGYQRRADERTMNNWFQYRDFVPSRFVRNWNINFNQWAGWNFGGDRLFSGGNINTHWTWTNNYNAGMGVNLNAAPFRDRITRGGPGRARQPVAEPVVLRQHRPAQGALVQLQRLLRSRQLQHQPPAVATPGSTSGPRRRSCSRPGSATRSTTTMRSGWPTKTTTDGTTHYVFGRIEQKTVAMTLRFNYTMTPNLSLQTYAEPFVSAGDYTNFRELVDGRAAAYADRYQPYAYTGDADFNIRSFRTTNVLRWEYKPGSQLFVVWQQGRNEQAVRLRRLPVQSRLRRPVLDAVEERVPGEVHVLVESVRDQGSGIRDQGSGIRDQGSGIRDQGTSPRPCVRLRRALDSSL